ncbi:hypothetical protein [Methanobacterium alcaliphilum]|uniref:hypothetical protein n=1 Tax=Methanobacterium alcaliphilum TaxID=392018 RepID=UPI00200B408B|nr:hypothetical protein [Methanobacterium alcaliphilum]MCK9151791.1 hypothetical protein [Methanobacterium alcaliphilum]
MILLGLGLLNTILLSSGIIIGIGNICLLSGLIYFYWKSYKELESKFTVGLLYFTSILLVQNILAIIALAIFQVLLALDHQKESMVLYSVLLGVNITQFIALTILFKITWE